MCVLSVCVTLLTDCDSLSISKDLSLSAFAAISMFLLEMFLFTMQVDEEVK